MNTAISSLYVVEINIHARHTAGIAKSGVFIGLQADTGARVKLFGRQSLVVSVASLRAVEMDGKKRDDTSGRELVAQSMLVFGHLKAVSDALAIENLVEP